jgi:hypothetical protein
MTDNESKRESLRLSSKESGTLKLIMRSPDIGDGWRQVSGILWNLVTTDVPAELVEFDHDNKRVRLNGDGNVLARYI